MLNRRLQNVTNFIIVLIAIVVIMHFGKRLLIPLVFAALFWFTVNLVKSFLMGLPVLCRIPSWIWSLIISLFFLFAIGFLSSVVLSNINSLARSYEIYESNIDGLLAQIYELTTIDIKEELQAEFLEADMGKFFGMIFNSLSDLLSNTFLILIYALFIFLEESTFGQKLRRMYLGDEDHSHIKNIIERVSKAIAKYLGLKTLMSFLTGLLSFFVFYFVGIDSPFFWAFLIFLFNYIPTVGSLIATAFPVLFCFLQFGSFGPGLITLAGVGGVQILVGNILDPRLMGNSMNVSPLVAILSLSFWGAVWGITGMILSVPIAIILVIVCSQFESTRNIAIMLSQNGRVLPIASRDLEDAPE